MISSLQSIADKIEKLLVSFSSFASKKSSSGYATALLGGVPQGGVTGTTSRTAIANVAVADSLSPFQIIQLKGDYATAGVGLRGQTAGQITLSGIPSGASVEKAYLYWSFLDDGVLPSEKNLTFNGTAIIGTGIGSGGDTCWGKQNSRAFRAEVTSLVAGNGTYALSDVASDGTLLAQGASLVVLYKDATGAERTIVVKDGNGVINSSNFNLATTLNGFIANGISAKTTFIVGDGQFFSDTLSFTGGRGTFTANDTFDGSDGELWDTDTHDVSSFVAQGDTSVSIAMPLVNDCLNWVAQVFSATSNGESSIGNVAAGLAKELVNSSYLFGGKGWEYNTKEFIAPTVIKTGYNFWNQSSSTPSVDFGKGVDCSGLVMWSYNRAFDPQKSRFNNFVKAEGADEQFRENTATTTESQLESGDVIFFDFDDNNFIDHVAMYVGKSGEFDVVSAVNRATGIRGRSKDVLKADPGFVAFKKVTSALPPPVLISAGSPIDLIVTDPDGFTITPTTIIPSELEFLRQIPGVLYYSEMEKGTDGRPMDQVYSYLKKTGDYLIKVLPEPDASPIDTFSLFFTTDLATTTVLAEHIPISNIPTEPYLIRSTETGIEKIIPVLVDIKPETIKLSSKETFNVLIQIEPGFGALVHDIDLTSIRLADAKPIKISFEKEDKICPANHHRKDNHKKDCDDDEEVLTLIAKFRAKDIKNIPVGKNVKILFTAKLFDGTKVEGADTVRVIKKS